MRASGGNVVLDVYVQLVKRDGDTVVVKCALYFFKKIKFVTPIVRALTPNHGGDVDTA